MSNYIESILERLLTPDSVVIKQATKQLLEYFVSDKCVPGLHEVLRSSDSKQNRIYAATLLRKKVKNWKSLMDTDKQLLKGQIIQILIREPEESVRKQIMWLMASMYKYMSLVETAWPDLLTFINDLILSAAPQQHLSGIFMLSILNEEAAEQMRPHFGNMFKIFATILSSSNYDDNMKSGFYVLSSLKSIIPFVGDGSDSEILQQQLNSLLPAAIQTAIKLIRLSNNGLQQQQQSSSSSSSNSGDDNDERVATVFEFLQALAYDLPQQQAATFVMIRTLTEMTLQFMVDDSLRKKTRICAINFLNVLIETHKANLIKQEMIEPILHAVFRILFTSKEPLQTTSDLDDEDHDDEDDQDEEQQKNKSGGGDDDGGENLFTAASQVLDYCAQYFPAKKFVKLLVEIVCPATLNEDYLHRRAALAALAVTAEGCADFYRNHYLEMLVDSCMKGMLDTNNQVVQVAYFALCQFSEFLQPNFQHLKLAPQKIMRLMVENLEKMKEEQIDSSISRLTVRFYDALQSFCENLGQEELEPFLPELMEKLLHLQNKFSYSFKFQRLIMSTFAAIVTSTKAHFNAYFDPVIQIVKSNLCFDHDHASPLEPKSLETKLLKIECIDLLGVFAKCISKEKFTEVMIKDSLAYVHDVLLLDADAEIRSAVYDLLTGLTSRMQENLPLKQVVPHILDTLRSEDGFNLVDSDKQDHRQQSDIFSAFDEIDLAAETDNDDDDDDDADPSAADNDGQKLIIENDYLAEKLSAMICLQEICKYQNVQLCDYYADLYEEIKILSEFLDPDVKKEAYLTWAHLIGFFHDYCLILSRVELDKTLVAYLNEFNTSAVKLIRSEPNRTIVWHVFDAVKILLTKCSHFIKKHLNEEFTKPLEIYTGLIFDTFDNKILCQQTYLNNNESSNAAENAENDEYEENQAEFDYLLKEYAGDLIPALALCLNEQPFFIEKFFDKVLQYLLKLLNKKPDASIAEKSFVIGVVGETINNMIGDLNQQQAQQLFTEFYKYTFSSEAEIRSNAIFTIGVLCSKSSSALQTVYGQIVNDLLSSLNENNNVNGGVSTGGEKQKQTLDNICGTLCHLYAACTEARIETINYELILSAIIDLLPLKCDYNEYFTFYSLIGKIVASNGEAALMKHFSKLVELSGHILYHKHYECTKKGVRELIVDFLNYFSRNYKQDLEMMLMQMKPEYSNEIRQSIMVRSF